MLMFVFLLPAIQVIFFCVAIGQAPSGLNLGIVNNEISEPDLCRSSNHSNIDYCDLSLFSCKMFKSNQTVTLINYQDETEAREAVQQGAVWGYLSIPSNLTDSMIDKFTGGLSSQEVSVSLDMSNHQVMIIDIE